MCRYGNKYFSDRDEMIEYIFNKELENSYGHSSYRDDLKNCWKRKVYTGRLILKDIRMFFDTLNKESVDDEMFYKIPNTRARAIEMLREYDKNNGYIFIMDKMFFTYYV